MNNVKTNVLLEKYSKNTKKSIETKEHETLLLLSNTDNDEKIKILKKIGLDSHLRTVEKKHDNLLRNQILSNKYGKNSYSGLEIMNLCNDNCLVIRRADSFKNKVPEIVAEKILEFIAENTKTNNKGITKTDLHIGESSFFILTTKDSFNGDSFDSATLFYREQSDYSHYNSINTTDNLIEIYSWGKPINSSITYGLDELFQDEGLSTLLIITLIVYLSALLSSFFKVVSVPIIITLAFLLSFIPILVYFKIKNTYEISN